MENPGKVYHLALSYNQYYNSLEGARCTRVKAGTSNLPSIIHEREEDVSHKEEDVSHNEPIQNIFGQSQLQKCDNLDIENDKMYEYVGLKEAKAYQSKLGKKRRNMNSLKRSTETGLSVSRISSLRSKEENTHFLTKEEVLKIYTPPSVLLEPESSTKRHLLPINQTILTAKSSPNHHSETYRNQNQSTRLAPLNISSNTLGIKFQKNEKSYLKIKEQYTKYSKMWTHQANFRKKHQKENGQSIIQKIDQFRKEVETQLKHELQEKKHHTHPEVWIQTLRYNKSLQNFYSNEEIPVISKTFFPKGLSKLQKEIEWVEEKDKQGCIFRANDQNRIKNQDKKEFKLEQNY